MASSSTSITSSSSASVLLSSGQEPDPIEKAKALLAGITESWQAEQLEELGQAVQELKPALAILAASGGETADKIARIFAAFAKSPDSLPGKELQLLAKCQDLLDPSTLAALRKLVLNKDKPSPKELMEVIIEAPKETVRGAVWQFVQIYGWDALREIKSTEWMIKAFHKDSLPLFQAIKSAFYRPDKVCLLPVDFSDQAHPLLLAAEKASPEFLQAVIEEFTCLQGGDWLVGSWLEKTWSDGPLIAAVRGGKVENLRIFAKYLIEEHRGKLLNELLRSTQEHHSLLCLAAMDSKEMVQEAFQILAVLSPEERERLINWTGTASPLSVAASQPAPAVLEALLDGFTAEEIKRGVKGDRPNHSFVEAALSSPNPENIRVCHRALGEQQWLELCGAGEKTGSLLHKAASVSTPEVLRAVYELLPIGAREHCLGADVSGSTPLHRAAHTGKADVLAAVLEIYHGEDPRLLQRALQPNNDGWTPFHTVCRDGNSDSLQVMAEELHRMGKEFQALAVAPLKCGVSIIHLAFSSGCKRTFPFAALVDVLKSFGGDVIRDILLAKTECRTSALHSYKTAERKEDYLLLWEIIASCGPEAIRACLEPIPGQRAPLEIALLFGYDFAVKPLLSLMTAVGSDCVRATFLHSQSLKGLFSFASEHPEMLDPLIEHLELMENERELLRVLGRDLHKLLEHPPIYAYLSQRLPHPRQRLLFILESRIFEHSYDWRTEGVQRFLCEAMEMPEMALFERHPKLSALTEIYPDLQKALTGPLDRLSQRISETDDAARRRELEALRFSLGAWQVDLTKQLVVENLTEGEVTQLTPLLLRCQEIPSDGIREDITVFRTPPWYKKLVEQQGAHLVESAGSKQPLLYIAVLQLLRDRGVSAAATEALRQILANLGETLFEGRAEGLLALDGLLKIARDHQIKDADLEDLVGKLITGDVFDNIRAVRQLLAMKRQDALGDSTDDLPTIAKRCFFELVPMGDVEDYDRKFQEKISSQRDPDSIIDYASAISDIEETRVQLGAWLKSVLNGTDLEERYAEKPPSRHLATVYAAEAGLRERLRHMPRALAAKTVSELSLGDESFINPLDHKSLYDKVIIDGHLTDAEERFPLLWEYLKAEAKDRQELGIAMSKAASKAARQRKQGPEQELICLTLNFQLQLMKICALAEKGGTDHLIRVIEAARAAAKELDTMGHPVGRIQNDLNEAISAAKRFQSCSVDDFIVSVTDHYWDLFRIGSDVIGSCQNVRGRGCTNKCLMGYVIDAKTVPIVVKKPGSDAIVARRLLRIELHGSKPVLFLERLYTNFKQGRIDEAVITFAKEAANYLGLDLYSRSAPGKPLRISLDSIDSPARWVYSDAARSISYGNYSIRGVHLVHKAESQCRASSSSST